VTLPGSFERFSYRRLVRILMIQPNYHAGGAEIAGN
jgi:hypothetical protein